MHYKENKVTFGTLFKQAEVCSRVFGGDISVVGTLPFGSPIPVLDPHANSGILWNSDGR